MTPQEEDQRLAVQIALSAVQAFFQIAVGFSAVLIGYYQFAVKDVSGTRDLTYWLIIVSGTLAMASMICGFKALSLAYKRGDGRVVTGANEAIWLTKPLSGWMGWQSTTGLLALLSFFIAVLVPQKSETEKTVASVNIDSVYIKLDRGIVNIRKKDVNISFPLTTTAVAIKSSVSNKVGKRRPSKCK